MSRGKKWTEEEVDLLLKLGPHRGMEASADWESIAEGIEEVAGNKRSAHATKTKWKKVKEEQYFSDEPQEQLVIPPVEDFWNEQKDYFLLVNFYDLSIDELRNHFGCSYAECAGRLEQLIDSTEMTHIELVRKAAIAVKESKQPPAQRVPKSRKERRLMTKISKLQVRLLMLRGEENE